MDFARHCRRAMQQSAYTTESPLTPDHVDIRGFHHHLPFWPELEDAFSEGWEAHTETPSCVSQILTHIPHDKSVHEDQLLLVPSAAYGIFLALNSLIDPNDEVLLLSPYPESHLAMLQAVHANIKIFPCEEDDGFLPNLDLLANALTNRIKAVLLSHPASPAGQAYSLQGIQKLLHLTSQREIPLICDESDGLLAPMDTPSFMPYLSKQPILIARDLGVSLGLEPQRFCYLAGSKEWMHVLRRLHTPFHTQVDPYLEKSIAMALPAFPKRLPQQLQRLEEQRQFMTSALDKLHGFRSRDPHTGYHILSNIQYYLGNTVGGAVPNTSDAFVQLMRDKAQLAMLSGACFGMEGFISLSYLADISTLETAIQRISQILER